MAAKATTVRIPAELQERLAAYCEATGATRNGAVIVALREHLDGMGARERALLEALRTQLGAREVAA